MKQKLILFFTFCCLLLGAQVQEITILQTSDTHASLDGPKASWLKMATLLKEERRLAGAENCLLIDTGDVVQGSLLASCTKGVGPLQAILHLPFDVMVPGNHEMDFGVEPYREYVRLLGDKLLSANFNIKGDPLPAGWRIFERGGARIAVIGIQASFYVHWLLPDIYARCSVEKGVEALKRLLPEVHAQKPDLIVLAIHQAWFEGNGDPRGVNEVNEIARRFPEIDLILGAHSHRRIPGRKIGLRSWYVQPGSLAQFFSIVKIQVDTKQHKVLKISSSLKGVQEDTPEDAELAAALAPYLERGRHEAQREIGAPLVTPIPSEGLPGKGCATSELICRAMAEVSGAQVVFHGKLSTAGLPAGKVTGSDLYRLIPYDNAIITFWATVSELEQIMAEQWKQHTAYRYCGPWNAQFEMVGEQAKLISIAGKAPDKERSYLVAVNSHTASGSGAFPILKKILYAPKAKMMNTHCMTREAVELYLRRHPGEEWKTSIWVR